ncbi:MAG: hypothetical protein MJZ37_07000 [Bacilli bacterium]|nr:hypothetical protein [Bacilli bacterium]
MFKDEDLFTFLTGIYETFLGKEWADWMFWSDVKRDYAYIMHWKLADVLEEDFNVW